MDVLEYSVTPRAGMDYSYRRPWCVFAPGPSSCYYEFMQYLRYKPTRLWILDTTAPFPDRSGYSTNATLTGSVVNGIALSRYASKSLVVNSTNYVTFPQNSYKTGSQNQNFSLAASIFIPDVGSTGNQQILSNLGTTDGLWFNGNTLYFTTAYASTGTATCSYVIPVGQEIDAVGVHTETKNMLFVNGELVDEVDILDTQQADVYVSAATGALYAGRLGTYNLLINSVAIYPRALKNDEVASMYLDNHQVSVVDPIAAYVGEDIPISDKSRPAFLNPSWTTADDWNSADLFHCFVDGDVLRPESINGSTMAGTWKDYVFLYNGTTISTIDSLNLWWTGLNVTVQISVDNSTWETVTRGVNVTTIPSGYNPTNKTLYLRVTFMAGQTDAYIEDLEIRAYTSNNYQQPSGRVITWTNPAVTLPYYEPYLLREDWGTKVLGGALDIGTDTSSALPMTVKTVEVWIKQLTASAPTLSTNLTTGSTVYTNGQAGSTIRRGEWNVQHYTKSAGFTGNINFSGQVQIGRVVIYDTALSSTQVANVVSNYLGTLISNRSSAGTLTIAEHSPAVMVYAHDWTTNI